MTHSTQARPASSEQMRRDFETAFSALEGEPSAMTRPRLIAVDDDPAILDIIDVVGAEAGYDVLLLSDPDKLADALERFPPHVIISDLMMPNVDGVTLLRNLGAARARCSVIVASAADPKTLDAAVRLGRGYGLDMASPMHKPFTATALHEALARSRGAISGAELRQALTNGQLEVWYQPKVSLRPADRDRIVGAEALVGFATGTLMIEILSCGGRQYAALADGPISLPDAVQMLDSAYLGHVIVLWSWALKQPATPGGHTSGNTMSVRFRSLDGRDREIEVPYLMFTEPVAVAGALHD